MKIVIVTGLSGAGKTSALKCLEDAGYYCLDNMPVALFDAFLTLLQRTGEWKKVALVMDTRDPEFPIKAVRLINRLKQLSYDLTLLFLEASDQTLVRRFQETRRRHPLAQSGNLIQGISLERQTLASVRQLADIVLDTSDMSIHQFRKALLAAVEGKAESSITVVLESFGFKYGVPPEASFVVDARFLPNPYFVPALQDKSGLENEVKEYVLQSAQTKQFLDHLRKLLDFVIPNVAKEGRSHFVFAVGCTGGRHRSVALVELLAEYLRNRGIQCSTFHRDIDREGD